MSTFSKRIGYTNGISTRGLIHVERHVSYPYEETRPSGPMSTSKIYKNFISTLLRTNRRRLDLLLEKERVTFNIKIRTIRSRGTDPFNYTLG